jgi:hypothetical protein
MSWSGNKSCWMSCVSLTISLANVASGGPPLTPLKHHPKRGTVYLQCCTVQYLTYGTKVCRGTGL